MKKVTSVIKALGIYKLPRLPLTCPKLELSPKNIFSLKEGTCSVIWILNHFETINILKGIRLK